MPRFFEIFLRFVFQVLSTITFFHCLAPAIPLPHASSPAILLFPMPQAHPQAHASSPDIPSSPYSPYSKVIASPYFPLFPLKFPYSDPYFVLFFFILLCCFPQKGPMKFHLMDSKSSCASAHDGTLTFLLSASCQPDLILSLRKQTSCSFENH